MEVCRRMDSVKYLLRPRRAISFTVFFTFFGLACAGSLRSQEQGGDLRQAAAEPSAAELLERFAAAVEDLEAGFERTVRDSEGELLEDPATGRFLLLRPDRFLWHEEAPFEQLLVADGESLWTYDVELEQVMRDPLERLAMTPAMLLAGSGDLNEHYRVERAASADDLRWIALEPLDAAGSDFLTARIAFDERDVPVLLEIVDGLENLTRIAFVDVEVNPGLDSALFEFEPPAGVHVVGGED